MRNRVAIIMALGLGVAAPSEAAFFQDNLNDFNPCIARAKNATADDIFDCFGFAPPLFGSAGVSGASAALEMRFPQAGLNNGPAFFIRSWANCQNCVQSTGQGGRQVRIMPGPGESIGDPVTVWIHLRHNQEGGVFEGISGFSASVCVRTGGSPCSTLLQVSNSSTGGTLVQPPVSESHLLQIGDFLELKNASSYLLDTTGGKRQALALTVSFTSSLQLGGEAPLDPPHGAVPVPALGEPQRFLLVIGLLTIGSMFVLRLRFRRPVY